MAMDSIPTGAAARIAVVTTDESVQLAAQEVLASAFHTTLLGSGEQIGTGAAHGEIYTGNIEAQLFEFVDCRSAGRLDEFGTIVA